MKLLRPYQAARKAGISRQRMHQLLRNGRVIGARKDSKGWLVPIPLRLNQGITQRRNQYLSNADAMISLMFQHDHLGASPTALAAEHQISLRTLYRRIAWARTNYPQFATLLKNQINEARSANIPG